MRLGTCVGAEAEERGQSELLVKMVEKEKVCTCCANCWRVVFIILNILFVVSYLYLTMNS